ncbi:glycosyl transferase [cyanobiont of Ornithocercus magnificus]|nr:glycosyl transferase [cyanobiont of Ornithocercus magnificus]
MTPSGEQQDLEQLFSKLSHPNPNVQDQAIWKIVDRYPSESLPRLISLLDQSDTSLRRAAVRSMGVFGAKALKPLVNKFKACSNPTVRASCVKAFVQISANYPEEPLSDDAMAILEQGLVDQDPVVSQSTVMAIAQVSKQGKAGKNALELLIKICTGDNIAHALSAAMALAEIDDPRSAECLRCLSDDPLADALLKEIVDSSLMRMQQLCGKLPPIAN